MLLHLGKDIIIPTKDIIAIIDKKSAFKSDTTKIFFQTAQEKGNIEETTDKTKTYILTEKKIREKETGMQIRKSIIYTSNISSITLKKRAGFIDRLEVFN